MRHYSNLVTVKVHRQGSGEAATAAPSVQNAFAKAFDLGKKIGEGFLLKEEIDSSKVRKNLKPLVV